MGESFLDGVADSYCLEEHLDTAPDGSHAVFGEVGCSVVSEIADDPAEAGLRAAPLSRALSAASAIGSNIGARLVPLNNRFRTLRSSTTNFTNLVGDIKEVMRGEVPMTQEQSNRKLLAGQLLNHSHSTAHTSASGSEDLQLSQQSFDLDVLELLTFDGCEPLLRHSELSDVMRRRGNIFGSSLGSAATYGISKQVNVIDAFLSHNWSVAQSKMFTALCFHYNFDPRCLWHYY